MRTKYSKMATHNAELSRLLNEMAELNDMIGEQYRSQAYARAAATVRKIQPITQDGVDAIMKKHPAGFGVSIEAKIREYVSTGRIAELDTLRQSPIVTAYRELTRIMGVGPVVAASWIDSGITGIASLRVAVAAGTIALTHTQALGLQYYDDLIEPIPRAEVTALAASVHAMMLKLAPKILFCVAGSYRRGAQTSGDIDILVSNEARYDPDLLIAFAQLASGADGYIAATSAGRERLTYLVLSPSGKVRQIDLLHIKYESFYAALLYFTGSWEFNVRMRGLAKAKKYRLNQTGLYARAGTARNSLHSGAAMTLIPVRSEREIFDAIGLQYVPPVARL